MDVYTVRKDGAGLLSLTMVSQQAGLLSFALTPVGNCADTQGSPGVTTSAVENTGNVSDKTADHRGQVSRFFSDDVCG
jgi:hypothetical protein